MAETTDILVIGGGVAGASAAYYLARAGGDVTLVEGEDLPGYHTTGRSAAFFAESYGGLSVLPLTVASRPFFLDPPPGFTDTDLVRPRGALHLFTHDQAEEAHARVEALASVASGIDMIDAAAVKRRVPPVALPDLAGAVDDPACKDIDVAALHQGFLSGMRAFGGRLRCKARVESLEWTGGHWQVDLAGNARIEAGTVVNAAGAWGDHVAEMAGATPVGLTPCRRTIIVFHPETVAVSPDWPLTFDLPERFYFKPESGGILASPADETPMPACDVQPDDEDVALTVSRLTAATAFDVPRIRRRWAGLRTFAPDRAPVIGFDRRQPGFFWSVGQGGWGIQTAPAWGRLAADLILSDCASDDLKAAGVRAEAYSPARFAKAA